jgi:glyoxylase-like metal-dependent hydrolase (beta-lactamase superfamily II)
MAAFPATTAAALCAALVSAAAPPARAEEVRPVADAFVRHTAPVTDRVWVIWRTWTSAEPPFEGNVMVVEQTDGLVVVDAGGSPLSGRHVVQQIRRISPKPVKVLIYTHYHGDHNLGAGALRRAWPHMRVVSTAATRRNMTGAPMAYVATYSRDNGNVGDFARKQLADPSLSERRKAGWRGLLTVLPSMVEAYKDMKPWPADVTFTDRLTVEDEAAPVEVMFLGRANTDGDAVVWLPKQRVLASGDVVVNPVPYASASYPGEWLAVLERLKGFDFAYLVPGHGPVQTDRAYLDKVSAAITTVRERVAPLAKEGLSLEEVRKRTDFSDVQRAFGGEDEWDRAMTQQFFIGALVSNAWKEARGEPIVQGRDGG